jgi:replicative DNA helicase
VSTDPFYDLTDSMGAARLPTVKSFQTLAEQVTALRDFASNPQQRVRSGLPTLDAFIEGPAAGEVYNAVGRSHAGKSMFGLQLLANNPDLGSVFFSLEMPARMALQRLYCMVTGVEFSVLHNQVTSNSLPSSFDEFPSMLPYTVVVDDNDLSLDAMSIYLEHYAAYYGSRPDFVVMDYLELIGGAKASGEGLLRVEAVAGKVKSWAKDEQMPVWILHQTNRSEKDYDPPTKDSARYGGYTEADVMIGMWQRFTDPGLSEIERHQEDGRVYFNVLKNRVTGKFPRQDRGIATWMGPDLRFRDVAALEKKQRLLG